MLCGQYHPMRDLIGCWGSPLRHQAESLRCLLFPGCLAAVTSNSAPDGGAPSNFSGNRVWKQEYDWRLPDCGKPRLCQWELPRAAREGAVARFQAGNTGPHRAPWAAWARVSPDSLMEDGLLEYPERHHAIAESCRPEALRGKALGLGSRSPSKGLAGVVTLYNPIPERLLA